MHLQTVVSYSHVVCSRLQKPTAVKVIAVALTFVCIRNLPVIVQDVQRLRCDDGPKAHGAAAAGILSSQTSFASSDFVFLRCKMVQSTNAPEPPSMLISSSSASDRIASAVEESVRLVSIFSSHLSANFHLLLTLNNHQDVQGEIEEIFIAVEEISDDPVAQVGSPSSLVVLLEWLSSHSG